MNVRLQVERLAVPGVLLLRPRRIGDDRGHLCETWNERDFAAAVGLRVRFVQDVQTLSRRAGTLRGLHFQRPPSSQAKLVRVLRGRAFDVAVDLRPESPHRGRWAGAPLSAEGGEQLFVPRGFAHGVLTLEDDTELAYKVDDFHDPAREGGLRWDDPALGIAWPALGREPILSPRDRSLPGLAELDIPPPAPDFRGAGTWSRRAGAPERAP
jgi:dTDP-4-dehydrorhamnose 3,5-epimerase